MQNKVNLGCGTDYRKDWINCDKNKTIKADKYFNAEKKYPIKSNTINYILADNIFEHFEHPENAFAECHRILKENGQLEIIVPYYNSWQQYGDITHKTAYSEQSFDYLIKGAGLEKKHGHEIKTKFSKIKIIIYYSKIGEILKTIFRTHKFGHYMPNTIVGMRIYLTK